MHEHGPKDDIDLLKRMGYETRDVRITPLVKSVIWLGVSLVIFAVIGWAVQYAFINRYSEGPVGRSVSTPSDLPPPPMLQVEPKREMRDFNAAAQAHLSSYGVDKKTGARYIPIERAMEIIAREGLNAGAESETIEAPRQNRAPAPGSEPERRAAAAEQPGTANQ